MQTYKLTSCVLVICLVLIGLSFLAGCTQKEPASGGMNESGIVKTDAGSVSGINQNGLQVFLGIPFAAPPTGDLRWRPPAPGTALERRKGNEGVFTILSRAFVTRISGKHERGLPVPQYLDTCTEC